MIYLQSGQFIEVDSSPLLSNFEMIYDERLYDKGQSGKLPLFIEEADEEVNRRITSKNKKQC